MSPLNFTITPEHADHDTAVEALNCRAFGPGRFARTAYRLRENVPHLPPLSFVALIDGPNGGPLPVGSVRQTPIHIADKPALWLGPLVVDPDFKGLGIGRELMNRTLSAAREFGHRHILLIGDEAYYGRFGFNRVPCGHVALPGPADPDRLLFVSLSRDASALPSGTARPDRQSNEDG